MTPRNVIMDMALAGATIILILMMWKLAPARVAAFAESLRPSNEENAAQERVPAIEPVTASLDVDSLLAMTYDRSSNIRSDAVNALADRGEIRALPRVQELAVVDGSDAVQQAAYHVEDQFRAHIATILNVPVTDIKYIAATESGDAYAVTNDSLFAFRDGEWRWASQLPDAPNGIATTPDAQTVYLATASGGLWRSLDAGTSWGHIQFGERTATQLTVTTVAVNPEHTWQIFVALAAPSSTPGVKNPLGIFVSDDEGESWHLLPDSPLNAITTRLVIHLPWTGFLYGVADGTPWRYTLPIEAM